MNRSITIIMNPKAGKGSAKTALFTICNHFSAQQDQVCVFVSQYQGHAATLASQWAANCDILLCIGGDGTWNEVINGVMQSGCKPMLAYLPTGTVNDFASTLRLKKDAGGLMKRIETHTLFACDIGWFHHQRYFSYVAAFGIFTDVSYHTPQQAKNTFGKVAYYLQGMKQLTNIPRYHIHLSVDEQHTEGEYMFGCISNSEYVAGFKTASTKNALMDDGQFEIMLIRTPNNPLDVQVIITALLKREINSDWMYVTTGREITVTAQEEIPWTIDGEDGGSRKETHIHIKDKAITILV